MKTLVGYEGAEVDVRSAFLDGVHPDDRPNLLQDLSLFSKKTLPRRRRVRLRSRAGMERRIDLDFCQVPGPAFDTLNLILLKDVTEDNYTSQRLKQYQALVDQGMRTWNINAIWWADTDRNLVDYIGRDELAFDREVLGQRYLEIVPEDARMELAAELFKIRDLEQPFSLPVRVTGVDGVTRGYQLRGGPFYENNTIAGWSGYVSATPLTTMSKMLTGDDTALLSRLSASVLKAGCSALGWSYADLALRSQLSTSTVNRILTTTGILTETFRLSSLRSILDAMKLAGVAYTLDSNGIINLRLETLLGGFV